MKRTFEEREEAILHSIDGIQPAEVPAYFYTRLLGRMQHELEKEKQPFIMLRPAFLAATLSIVLIINIVFLFQIKEEQRSGFPAGLKNQATIESFATAYGLDVVSTYE